MSQALAEEFKQKGNAEFKKGNHAAAIELYSRGIAEDGTNYFLFSNRAACHTALGNHKAAADDASKTVSLNPKFAKGFYRLGHAHFYLGDYELAVSAFVTALELSETPDGSIMELLNQARAHLRDELSKKIPAQVADPNEAKRIGNMLFKDGNYAAASTWYTRAIDLTKAAPTKDTALFYINRAACNSQTHAYSAVVEDCTAALAIDDKLVKAYLRRAIAYEGMEKWSAAAADYKKVIECDPNNTTASSSYHRCKKYAAAV